MKYTRYEDWTEYKTDFMERFTLDDSYVICGAGGSFRSLLELFPELKVAYCLDAKAEEMSAGGGHLYSYERLKEEDVKTQKFIITPGCEYYSEIKGRLLGYGVLEENIVSLQELLFFWGIRYRKKLLENSCAVVLLTQCNLRCRACVQFVPYIKHHMIRDVEDVKMDLEQYFQVFDYVRELVLSGGEPMLYKGLGEICEYIDTSFAGRYGKLQILTNGLIVPKEETIQKLSNLDKIHIIISDYTCSIQKNQNALIQYLERYNIQYTLNNTFSQSAENRWFDLGDPTVPKDEATPTLNQKFEKCSLIVSHLYHKKIYFCAPSWSAVSNNLIPLTSPETCLDLESLGQMELAQKMDIIGRFNFGFCEKGHLEFCRFCNGYGKDVNTCFVRAGEQC